MECFCPVLSGLIVTVIRLPGCDWNLGPEFSNGTNVSKSISSILAMWNSVVALFSLVWLLSLTFFVLMILSHRVLIKNLLVSYFQLPNSQKQNGLRVIGSLLHFTEEEYAKVSLSSIIHYVFPLIIVNPSGFMTPGFTRKSGKKWTLSISLWQFSLANQKVPIQVIDSLILHWTFSIFSLALSNEH